MAKSDTKTPATDVEKAQADYNAAGLISDRLERAAARQAAKLALNAAIEEAK